MTPEEFWPGDTLVYARDECFLCGVRLTDANRTAEHVIPQWLQREFDLWQQRLVLLNGTDIPYANLKVPCCKPCNVGPLETIESRVLAAYRGGLDAFRVLDENTLFLWLGKILYSLLVRELHLPNDRKDPDSGTIVQKDDLEAFQMHHYLLQAVLGRVRWTTFPASIFVYSTKMSGHLQDNFDFMDGPHGPFLALRMGPIGIVAVLQDWGSLAAHHFPKLDMARDMDLSPFQFREVAAFVQYVASLFNRNPNLIIGKQPDGVVEVACLPLMGLSRKPLYDPMVVEDQAFVLGHAVDLPPELLTEDGLIRTWLMKADGTPLDLPFSTWPKAPEKC